MTPQEVQAFVKANNIQIIDLKFIDLPGLWQHFSIPVSELDDGIFTSGLGFDGSSIRGFQKIQESDMLLIPDPATAVLDPVCAVPTLSMVCDIFDPIKKEAYSRDPRYIAKKAEAYLKTTGLGDTVYFGPEAEFFLFDDVRYESGSRTSYFSIDSSEAIWNSAAGGSPNLAYKIRHKEGYFPVPPHDTQQDIRTEMCLEMERMGIEIETQHHEVATAGQAEIDMKFDTLVSMGDKLLKYKYVVKNVAKRHGMTATFMPKPLFKDNGSGMHTHQSIWKDGKPLFAGDKYAGLSEMALYYIGGILKHSRALAAFTNPTTNSYKRLVPGYEAPVNLAYSSRNRSASCRIPTYSQSPKAKRVEVRYPDPACNPYIAFAAMLMAGVDGVINKIHPGEPLDKNIYALSAEEAKGVPTMPGSLDEAVRELESDHEFLLQGGVFSQDLIQSWIDYKRENDIDPIRLRPHPHEFELYYDV